MSKDNIIKIYPNRAPSEEEVMEIVNEMRNLQKNIGDLSKTLDMKMQELIASIPAKNNDED